MPADLPLLESLRSFVDAKREYSTLHGISHVYVGASSSGRIDYDSERALQGFEGLKVRCSVLKPVGPSGVVICELQPGEKPVAFQPGQGPMPALSREVMLVDGLHQVNRALVANGRTVPGWNDYPPDLEAFYGRKVETTTWGELDSRGGEWFVKKTGKGGFQPMVARFPFLKSEQSDDVDPYNVCHIEPEDVVLASEPVNFVAEWRAFIVCHKVVDVRQYRGDWRAQYDRLVVSAATDAFNHSSQSYAIDFGLTDDGRTLVVETNPGFALGAYGLMPDLYATLLASGWAAAWGSEP
jgi:hypothetical protein